MTADLVQIPQDDRVSVGQDGNLYFANVKHSDSREDYYCCAGFSRIRTIVQSMPMALTVLPTDSLQERRPKMLTPQGTSGSVTALRGEELHLECIAEGLPTPSITWYREKSGAVVLQSHGKLLKMKDISEEDEGIYRCKAENSWGSVDHGFHVWVEGPPRWREEPRDRAVSVGASAVLHCSAMGKPEPEISWKRNGLPLGEGSVPPNHHVLDKEIILKNLQLSDTAVYQCESRNKHGTILSSANINVLDIAPVILTPEGTTYSAVLGSPAFLHCEAFAFPRADIFWSREDSAVPMQTPRSNTYGNGTLHILKAEAEDAGDYTCWVSNARGKTALGARLILREPTRVFLLPESPLMRGSLFPSEPTRVFLLPESPSVRRSHGTTLTCHVQCDIYLLSSLSIIWRRNGHELDRSDRRVLIQLDTLSISNVSWEDGGTYSCTAHTSLDTVTAETHLRVQDVPNPPTNLVLSEKHDRSIQLSWETNETHNSPILEFIIEAQRSNETWEDAARVAGNRTAVALPLVPYTDYRFRVFAINEIGKSLPSPASERYRTPAMVPDRNPLIVSAEADKQNELTITWEPLSQEEQNGPGFGYRVRWRLQGSESEWHHQTVKESVFRLNNTPAFAPYEVSVQSVNEKGAGPDPKIHVKYSGEDIPDAAPSALHVEVLNSSLAKVAWARVTQNQVRGHLSGYKVTYWKARSLLAEKKHHHPTRHVLIFPGPRNWGMIPGLDPFSQYQVMVAAFNTRGDGPGSSPVTFETPEGVPDKPHSLRISSADKSSFTLTWGPPRKLNGILSGYLLQHQIINDTDEIGTMRNINITDPATVSWRIPWLHHGTKYKFYLRACTARGCGKAVSEEGWTGAQAKQGVPSTSPGTEVQQPGGNFTTRQLSKTQGIHRGISEDVMEKTGRGEGTGAGVQVLATQGWLIGLMGAVALLTLTLLTACFVLKNKGGKYSVKEKDEAAIETEVQMMRDELFADYSDKKPLNESADSLSDSSESSCSMDSLVQYSDGEHEQFNEDGSFIGEYTESRDRSSKEMPH
uniref:Neural cell adhesion molecule L1-like protein n=1 Tax=Xenopus tropicalis TaxID=8364 RepID=A0A803J1Z5_XENTR